MRLQKYLHNSLTISEKESILIEKYVNDYLTLHKKTNSLNEYTPLILSDYIDKLEAEKARDKEREKSALLFDKNFVIQYAGVQFKELTDRLYNYFLHIMEKLDDFNSLKYFDDKMYNGGYISDASRKRGSLGGGYFKQALDSANKLYKLEGFNSLKYNKKTYNIDPRLYDSSHPQFLFKYFTYVNSYPNTPIKILPKVIGSVQYDYLSKDDYVLDNEIMYGWNLASKGVEFSFILFDNFLFNYIIEISVNRLKKEGRVVFDKDINFTISIGGRKKLVVLNLQKFKTWGLDTIKEVLIEPYLYKLYQGYFRNSKTIPNKILRLVS
jgi:hypothetical protein